MNRTVRIGLMVLIALLFVTGIVLIARQSQQNQNTSPSPSVTPPPLQSPASTGIVTTPTTPASEERVTQVKTFLIALEDQGKSGPAVGCGDSAVAVTRMIAPTTTPLTAAIQELLSQKSQYYG